MQALSCKGLKPAKEQSCTGTCGGYLQQEGPCWMGGNPTPAACRGLQPAGDSDQDIAKS